VVRLLPRAGIEARSGAQKRVKRGNLIKLFLFFFFFFTSIFSCLDGPRSTFVFHALPLLSFRDRLALDVERTCELKGLIWYITSRGGSYFRLVYEGAFAALIFFGI